jgi:hypothetical protein
LVVGGAVVVSTALAGESSPGTARVLSNLSAAPPVPAEPSTARPGPRLVEVSVEVEGFLAWAALHRASGQTMDSSNAEQTSSTESMIKVWIVADYLRRVAEQGAQPSEDRLRDARLAIRDSHNLAAERLYAAGGRDAVVNRLVDICGLSDTHVPAGGSGWWSRTQMSARDAVRMGTCVADGTAAGPEWTDWVLAEMRAVRGTTADADQRPDQNFEGGRWGLIDGLPEPVVERGVAIKNGWTRIGATGSWHLNCLAITGSWVLAVMMRYPAEFSLDYGAERCASIASQLVDERPARIPPH